MTDYAIIHADEQIALAIEAIAKKTDTLATYAGYIEEFAEAEPSIAEVYRAYSEGVEREILYFSELKTAAEALKQKRMGA